MYQPQSLPSEVKGWVLGSEGLYCQVVPAFDDAVGIGFHINFSMLQYAISSQKAIIIYNKLKLTFTWYYWHKLQ